MENIEEKLPQNNVEGYEQDDYANLVIEEILNLKVDPGQEPLRLDKFIQVRVQYVSRTKVRSAIENGMVTINGNTEKCNYKVRPGDHIIAFRMMPENHEIIIPQPIPIDIVYEDKDIMLINKQPNMVVHPGAGNHAGTLCNAVAYHYEQQQIYDEDIPRMGMVHRIDKDTSGLILFAKTEMAAQNLAAQFKDHSVERTYNALVWGDVDQDEGTINVHIDRHDTNRMWFTTVPDGDRGKHAITHFKVLERFGYVTLIQCKLETGRTHQIRVHMKSIGHTLFSDVRYGGNRILKGTVYAKYKQFVDNCFALCPRQALHAKTLGFIHPRTGEKMSFNSEIPADMAAAIDKWRKYVSNREELDN